MTSTVIEQKSEIFYPSEDGEPLAESYEHVDAILMTLEVLREYLAGQQATVLADQFLYYSEGMPRLRVAPDVMVIFDVAPGGRDHYKIWAEGQVPRVIFEMTSPSTRQQDLGFKYTLYGQLGVAEYWLFDPKGEWIEEQLRGYRLVGETYELIEGGLSAALGLRLVAEGRLIGFYRQDTGERLLLASELRDAWEQERARAEQERERAEQERERAEQERARADALAAQLRELGVEPNS
ncbi:Uma2 family endonuclease [Spirulina sp. CCNP1310]|uniref:Uma2 family endonuclease n=1 Tax=Spirulina sp. CCNP1310 TaxID=3110249 RepID=UPI002B212CF7|nr:Uma2 family endonuclease [Spirulina sp. CCNP1310]MEA5421459.1 Uma2 family endonuclease [Spirulina sp. CCNP1310]